jgi:Fe-S oxidoreductase
MDTMIGRIGTWLPIATRISGVVNTAMKMRPFRAVAEKFGLASHVKFPAVASSAFRNSKTCKHLMQDTRVLNGESKTVLLWTDTFNNGFSPEVLEASVRVLQSYGVTVRLMSKQICCGRPYYDAGMLDHAKRNLVDIMAELKDVIALRLPVVVLEPSCLSVFRDELRALFPKDEKAAALATSVKTLAEYLEAEALMSRSATRASMYTGMPPKSLRRSASRVPPCRQSRPIGSSAANRMLRDGWRIRLPHEDCKRRSVCRRI